MRFSSEHEPPVDVDVPFDELTVVVMGYDFRTGDGSTVDDRDDPWATTLLEYLNTVEAARAERGDGLASAATGQVWTYLVPTELQADVAYHRDRWNITDQMSPIGPEPAERRSAQHNEYEQLDDRLGPTGTLAELAARRAAGGAPTADAVLGEAMARRRDAIVAAVHQAQRPPPWAHELLGRTSWAPMPPAAARQRDTIAKVAVYRERFAISGDGIGLTPSDETQRRIWLSLRDALRAPAGRDGHDAERTRHNETDNDVDLER